MDENETKIKNLEDETASLKAGVMASLCVIQVLLVAVATQHPEDARKLLTSIDNLAKASPAAHSPDSRVQSSFKTYLLSLRQAVQAVVLTQSGV